MIALSDKTAGERFLHNLGKAGNHKGGLFALLYETLQTDYPNIQISTVVNQVKNFDALVNYDASVAKFQIARNAENIRKTITEIKKIKVLGKDNFKYKKLMIKKLNALANVKPDAKAIVDITAAEFIAKGFGNVNSFKCEFMHYIHSLHSVSAITAADSCVLHC